MKQRECVGGPRDGQLLDDIGDVYRIPMPQIHSFMPERDPQAIKPTPFRYGIYRYGQGRLSSCYVWDGEPDYGDATGQP